MKPCSRARSRFRRRTWRGQPSNGVPSRLKMSQNTRATGASSGCQGRIWNVLASGRARTSLSWTREKPSMAEPSKVMPSSRAFSSSAGVMAKVLAVPRTSVNHSCTNRTARSSTVLSTYSCWLRMWPPRARRRPSAGALSKCRRLRRGRGTSSYAVYRRATAAKSHRGRLRGRPPTARRAGAADADLWVGRASHHHGAAVKASRRRSRAEN